MSSDIYNPISEKAKTDKDEFLRYLGKLMLAQKVELKNERMLNVNLIDTLVKKRLSDYTELINQELQ